MTLRRGVRRCVPCRDSDLLMSRNSHEPMWGRLAACGRLSIGLSNSALHHEWPVTNRPQAASLPHIGSCSFHVDSEIPADLRRSETFPTRLLRAGAGVPAGAPTRHARVRTPRRLRNVDLVIC